MVEGHGPAGFLAARDDHRVGPAPGEAERHFAPEPPAAAVTSTVFPVKSNNGSGMGRTPGRRSVEEGEGADLDASGGGAPAGVSGSSKAECAVKRARPSLAESKHLMSIASSGAMSGA